MKHRIPASLLPLIAVVVVAGCTFDANLDGYTFVDDDVAGTKDTLGGLCERTEDCALRPLSGACRSWICSAENRCEETTAPDGASCDDGDPCTSSDHCDASECSGFPVSCDDGVDCTNDGCDPMTGACVHVRDDAACPSDGPCKVGACDLEAGCVFANGDDGTSCDDGSVCTKDDVCLSGSCVGERVVCGDGEPCVEWTCDPEDGCLSVIVADGSPCDDGDPCTERERCANGACGDGEPVCECVDDADCVPFEDGDACNGVLHCVGEHCVVDPSTVVGCPGIVGVCWEMRCVPESGECVEMPSPPGVGCDDGFPCTTEDACDGAGACVGTPYCDDDNPCTRDECRAQPLSCTNTPVLSGTACDDGDPCTSEDACFDGECVGDPDPLCVICQGREEGAPCDDADPCSTDDRCVAGRCAGDVVPGCHDCFMAPDGASCDDGSAETRGDLCWRGTCVGWTMTAWSDGARATRFVSVGHAGETFFLAGSSVDRSAVGEDATRDGFIVEVGAQGPRIAPGSRSAGATYTDVRGNIAVGGGDLVALRDGEGWELTNPLRVAVQTLPAPARLLSVWPVAEVEGVDPTIWIAGERQPLIGGELRMPWLTSCRFGTTADNPQNAQWTCDWWGDDSAFYEMHRLEAVAAELHPSDSASPVAGEPNIDWTTSGVVVLGSPRGMGGGDTPSHAIYELGRDSVGSSFQRVIDRYGPTQARWRDLDGVSADTMWAAGGGATLWSRGEERGWTAESTGLISNLSAWSFNGLWVSSELMLVAGTYVGPADGSGDADRVVRLAVFALAASGVWSRHDLWSATLCPAGMTCEATATVASLDAVDAVPVRTEGERDGWRIIAVGATGEPDRQGLVFSLRLPLL